MFFSRVYSFFFLFVSLGLFACAKPIDTKVVERTYPAVASHTGQDLVDVLVALKAKILADVALFDGVKDPSAIIVADVNAAVDLIADIDLDTPILDVQVDVCVQLIVDIIVTIAAGLKSYNLLTIFLSICAAIDVALCALVTACIKIYAPLGIKLALSLNVDVALCVAVNLVLTLAAIGL